MKLILIFIIGVACGYASSTMETPSVVAPPPSADGYKVINADTVEWADGTRTKYDHKKNWQPKL